MVITVLGWYGTETIGDRAILAGILYICSQVSDEKINLKLGSLYNPLCERTCIEDEHLWIRITENKYESCKVFNSLNTNELKTQIEGSDILMVGGGPLMDIESMYMLKYAFRYAKKKRIRTVLMGCGWGPFNIRKYEKVGVDLVHLSDLTIFRDKTSLNELYNHTAGLKNVFSLIDPAFITAYWFRKRHQLMPTNDFCCINLREMFVTEVRQKGRFCIDDCEKLILQVMNAIPHIPIKLIPMHTFCIGGDDRIILNKIANRINSDRIIVQNKPLSLEDTMELFYNSKICIGMRFHSIVLQMVLNGYNYIMDYTEPDKGKIINILHQLKLVDSFKDRYVHYDNIKSLKIDKDIPQVQISDETLESYLRKYIDIFKTII